MTKFIDVSKLNDAKEEKEIKKTVFTHYLHPEEGFINSFTKPSEFGIIVYLGKCKINGDMFACHTQGLTSIYKGTKGYEFN